MVRQSQRKKAALPERFRNGEDQEASSSSKSAAPAPTTPASVASASSTAPRLTPLYSSSSSPSVAPNTPTPVYRRAEQQRALLPSRAELEGSPEPDVEEPAASIASAQPVEPAQMPARTPADDYDINSPYFGLNHTPEWDDLGIDIDDQSQERWFPPGLMAPPSYDSLSSAAKLMLFHELTKKMSFKNLVSYLGLTDLQLIDFTEVYEVEAQRNALERTLTLVAMKRLDSIRRNEGRLITIEDFDLALLEEVDSKLPDTALESPISLSDIGKAIAFLQSCHGSQIAGSQLNNGRGRDNNTLSLSEVNGVITEMGRYTRLGNDFCWDLEHELGLREYIESETILAGGGGLSGDEAEQPARPPIGRPKKRGKHFANKPLRNKSDLLKMVLPSKLQQMESVGDEAGDEAGKKAEGSGLNKGKGRGK
ncbi:uncharacterized protein EAF02_007649 [Botrytis sinoallii]|uniref:uncharacterized protein n=1 Tax=Botrytis sinoallii TaxID=1463999 RepID=UPI0019000C24|nr:uncharacterized protein EAF02_007649 [Botrytis sinoallii]KAF7880012.1 hypothetical protein EAF02_007649 [Botrytis sinoallii]